MNLGPTELLIVLAVVLVLFGGAKIPKLARSLGQAQKEFKAGVDEGGVGHRRRRQVLSGPARR
jgi:sec-independent protein translocase protein TatA